MADGYNTAYYDQQSNDARYRANTDRAQNAYGRFLSQQRGERSLGDMSRTFNRGLGGYRSGFAQRGLAGPGMTSGVMQRSMANYLGDFSRAYSRAQEDAQADLQQYDLADASISQNLNNSLADIERNKQNDIANAALAIEALRPYLGGL